MNAVQTGVSYFSSRDPRHVASDMRAIRENHCTYVVHTFSETDLAFYRRTIKDVVRISHDEGLLVHIDPWGVGQIFGGETFSQFIARHPQACQMLSTGERVPAACLNHPTFREFMRGWVEAALETGADVIFWDEPHFYIDEKGQGWTCRCEACQRLYEKQTGQSMPLELTREVRLFRNQCIRDFVQTFADQVRQAGRINCCCFLPIEGGADGIEDWASIVSIESLDMFGTDPYWYRRVDQAEEMARHFSRKIVALSRQYQKEAQFWLLNFLIQEGWEDKIRATARIAYQEGVRNFAAWSYYGSISMSHLVSQNPQKVWQTLGEIYRELRA